VSKFVGVFGDDVAVVTVVASTIVVVFSTVKGTASLTPSLDVDDKDDDDDDDGEAGEEDDMLVVVNESSGRLTTRVTCS
jgi:hypothetical protein